MTITKKILSLAMVVVLSLNGCADLDVGNTNAVSYTHLTLPTKA